MQALSERVEEARDDAAALESIYRKSRSEGREAEFTGAVAALARQYPDNVLLAAWAYRLDVQPGEGATFAGPEAVTRVPPDRRWIVAVPTSILLGFVFALLAWGKPPMPLPGVSQPAFVLGWGTVTTAAILVFGFAANPDKERLPAYGVGILLLAAFFALAAWKGWEPAWSAIPRSTASKFDDQALLIALHLPFVSWAILAGVVCARLEQMWKQLYAFVAKSAEVVVTAGLYLIAGVVFSSLTVGIFTVLGIELPDGFTIRFAAWGFGVIPVLAVATAYDPSRTPAEQDWRTGLARVLRILVRLMLPLALAVLVVYVAWFIPLYFWQAFKERETLIVYNATIMAMIAVLACAAPGLEERLDGRQSRILRLAIVMAGVLTLLLNAYALAAVIGRALAGGYTPNRHAVIGWNVVTLLMLATVLARQALAQGKSWADVFRNSIAQALVLAVAWATWIVVGLPHF